MNIFKTGAKSLLLIFCASCGTYFNQPVDFQDARIGENTEVTETLTSLPMPKEKVVVGVYGFRDLTGQYKASEMGSTFSTAVTQGATSILIKALEDSRWFIPIERENIGNLLNERNIIRSTRQEYSSGGDSKQPNLPPLLYAGILIEGGIVSYDTNIITGGFGARYFGVGGSTQYRQDRVTIYLRAVSTSSGKILKNVYISKTIFSQALDASLFKYVNFKRLLEVETGVTRNEPVHLAVTEAIEKGVEGLILEGIQDKIWETEDESLAKKLLEDYTLEKEEAGMTALYDRKLNERKSSAIAFSFGTTLLSGDYSNSTMGYLGKIDFSQFLTRSFSLNLSGNFFQLDNNGSFNENIAAIDLNARFHILPDDKISPFVHAGPGYLFSLASDVPEGMSTSFPKFQYGGGIEYLISENIGFKIFAEHNLTLSDDLDYLVHGKRDDHYFNFGAGINFYLGKFGKKVQNTK